MASPPSPTKTAQPTKLRDSCNACAVSKLKCSKEKPECARCAKRGQRCEYFATRRAGRRHEPRSRQQDTGSSSNSNKTSILDDSSDARSSVHVAVSTRPPEVNNHSTPPWDMDVHMADDTTTDPSLSDALSSEVATLTADDAASWRMLSSAAMPDAHDIFASFQMPTQLFIPGVGEDDGKEISSGDKDGFDFGDFTGFLAPDSATLVLDETAFDAVDQFRLSSAWDSPSSPSLSSLSSHLSSVSPSLTTASVLTAATTQHASVSNSPRETCSLAPPAAASSALPIPAPTSSCCVIRAMELLTTLFLGSGTCTCQASGPEQQQSHPQDSAFPTTEHVVTKNKQTLDAIQAMLDCPCSAPGTNTNGYLLAIISLTVLKILGWYKAAALPSPCPPSSDSSSSSLWKQAGTAARPRHPSIQIPDPSKQQQQRGCHSEQVMLTRAPSVVVDGYRLEGDDGARMAAQLVLSELHRVQRLVNGLGERLREQKRRDGRESGAGAGEFFSPVWFGQLEADLRRRVRGLSLEIVDLLRQ